jgi:hypothetical protein
MNKTPDVLNSNSLGVEADDSSSVVEKDGVMEAFVIITRLVEEDGVVVIFMNRMGIILRNDGASTSRAVEGGAGAISNHVVFLGSEGRLLLDL